MYNVNIVQVALDKSMFVFKKTNYVLKVVVFQCIMSKKIIIQCLVNQMHFLNHLFKTETFYEPVCKIVCSFYEFLHAAGGRRNVYFMIGH